VRTVLSNIPLIKLFRKHKQYSLLKEIHPCLGLGNSARKR